MKEQIRASGRRAAYKVAPGVAQSLQDLANLREAVGEMRRQVGRLRRRVAELEDEVQENRRLNRRLAELTDIVQELLLPVAQRDEKRLNELLERYSESL
ncbi:MAG: DUF5798 family protein [Nocardioidaceae bacterium]